MARKTALEHPEPMDTTKEQLAELKKRLAELDENPEAGEPWEVIRARILEAL